MIPVKGHKNLYRDENSNAIVNCNDSEFQDYIHLKNKKMNESREIDSLKKELEDLKSQLSKLLSNQT